MHCYLVSWVHLQIYLRIFFIQGALKTEIMCGKTIRNPSALNVLLHNHNKTSKISLSGTYCKTDTILNKTICKFLC